MTMFENIFKKIENKQISIPLIFFSVLTIGTLRNFEEHILKSKRIFGFGNEYLGIQTTFIHYNLFWIVTFLSLSFVLFALTKRTGNDYRNCLKIVLYGFPLILLPPAFDILIGNYGFIGYPNNPIEVFNKILFFLDVRVEIFGITPGMRYEIVIGCTLISLYVFFKTNSILKSVYGFLMSFCVILTLGLFVSIIGNFYDNSFSETNTFILHDSAFYNSGRIFGSISQKISSLFLIILVFELIIAFLILDFKRVFWLVKNTRPTRSLHYIILYLGGVIFSFVFLSKSNHLEFEKNQFFDYWSVFIGLIAIFFSFQSAVIYNDIYDFEIDKISNADRPLIKGIISKPDYYLIGLLLLAISLLASFLINITFFSCIVVYHLLAFLYSCPPFRLRNHFIPANLILSLVALISFHSGASLLFNDFSFNEINSKISVSIVTSYFIIMNIKDIKDMKGDSAANVATLFTIINPNFSKQIMAILISILCFILPVYLQLNGFLYVSIIAVFVININLFFLNSREWIFFVVYFYFLISIFYYILNSQQYVG
jgi:4-hydroxybenzoate polyprenyltransferase